MSPTSLPQPTHPRGYIWQFDILRGLAVLAVIYFHAGKHLPRHQWLVTSGWYGWCGVDLFFVLSGFLITGILLDARGTDGFFTNFYARRILRIWPLYFAMLGMLLVVLPHIVPAMMAESVASARPVWAYPLFLQNLFNYGKPVGPLGCQPQRGGNARGEGNRGQAARTAALDWRRQLGGDGRYGRLHAGNLPLLAARRTRGRGLSGRGGD
jgi:hypothetical protein